MNRITVRDKSFSIFITSEQVQNRISEMAEKINADLNGKNPVFICILKGALFFSADLLKKIRLECEISFMRVSSYSGLQSTGNIRQHFGLTDDITGRSVVILEDIVDSGDTVVYLLDELKKGRPAEVRIASLLLKPASLKHHVRIDYTGFEVPDDFLVGYGLDYDGIGRNLNDIYKLTG